MREFLERTWFLNRAIVSEDIERTLDVASEYLPLTIHRFPSGLSCFDWVIPQHWTVRAAYVESPDGERIIDWSWHPLHLVIGSLPFRGTVSRDELLRHLHTSSAHPDCIPYHFQYYQLGWGF